MGRYRFLDDVAIADVAFEAWGKTEADLFEACALATFEAMVELDQVRPSREINIQLEDESLERLLFGWLAELVFLKDAEAMFFSRFQVEVGLKDGNYVLNATVAGEVIDPGRHSMRSDVKAPTLHLFEVQPADGGWRAHVVLDV